MADLKYGDTVIIRGDHGPRWYGKRGHVLSVLPKGTLAEVRVHGDEPRNGECYPAFPVEDLEVVTDDPTPAETVTEEQRAFARQLYDAALVARNGCPPEIARSIAARDAAHAAEVAELKRQLHFADTQRDAANNTLKNLQQHAMAELRTRLAEADRQLASKEQQLGIAQMEAEALGVLREKLAETEKRLEQARREAARLDIAHAQYVETQAGDGDVVCSRCGAVVDADDDDKLHDRADCLKHEAEGNGQAFEFVKRELSSKEETISAIAALLGPVLYRLQSEPLNDGGSANVRMALSGVAAQLRELLAQGEGGT